MSESTTSQTDALCAPGVLTGYSRGTQRTRSRVLAHTRVSACDVLALVSLDGSSAVAVGAAATAAASEPSATHRIMSRLFKRVVEVVCVRARASVCVRACVCVRV